MRPGTQSFRFALLNAALLTLLASCSRPAAQLEPITWVGLIHELIEVDRLARLDRPSARIVTSVDPTGGNNDYNHFVRSGPPGWVVLADLEGPGYVSRFWMTGPDSEGEHRLRFYVDDGDAPLIETTLGEWCGRMDPYRPPIANYENYCWYSYVPIPYRKRLIIMAEDGSSQPGGAKLYYQVNFNELPDGQEMESIPAEITPEAREAIETVREAWRAREPSLGLERTERRTARVTIPPGQRLDSLDLQGPAVIRRLEVSYALPDEASNSSRELALREVILNIGWNGEPSSVRVPLGDFFGSFWRPTRYRSFLFGMTGDAFFTLFPMPFERRATIGFENQGNYPVTLEVKAAVEPLKGWDSELGYFHAAWTKTRAQDVGRPHDVLRVQGAGRFAGCILSATSFDKSWWLLEGDEYIRVDGASTPGWLGTGLEDYFNGGWYYQNVVARPLHGLPFKAPFRTVQYRIQLPDTVAFDESIEMAFERGPDNASHGEMESVAFYYGAEPYPAASRLGSPLMRHPPRDPFAAGTVMIELCNHERLGDYQGARDYIDTFAERYPTFPFLSMLRLRHAAYTEKLEGFEAARPQYEAFLEAEGERNVAAQAESLLWFHEHPSHALLAMYCSLETRAYLDGELLGRANSREQLAVHRVTLTPGTHTLVLQADWKEKRQLEHIQVYLRTHHGDMATRPDWRMALRTRPHQRPPEEGSAEWPKVKGTGVKGPPEAPFAWMEPNAMVDAQSQATGFRPPDAWDEDVSYAIYYTRFEL